MELLHEAYKHTTASCKQWLRQCVYQRGRQRGIPRHLARVTRVHALLASVATGGFADRSLYQLFSEHRPQQACTFPAVIEWLVDVNHSRQRARPPPTNVANLVLHSWNVTTLAAAGTLQYQRKMEIIRSLAMRGPVMLQETHWEDRHAAAARITLGSVAVFHAPATSAVLPGTRGGVAILLPGHYPPPDRVEVLVPGYALLVQLQLGGVQYNLISAYLRPGEEMDIFRSAMQSLARMRPVGQIVIGMDANRLPKRQKWMMRRWRFRFSPCALVCLLLAGPAEAFSTTSWLPGRILIMAT